MHGSRDRSATTRPSRSCSCSMQRWTRCGIAGAVIVAATALGLPLRAAIDGGHVHVLCMSRETLRIGEFLTVLADRLMLRYREARGGMDSMLTVVKTRGREHDRGTHRFSIGHGGVRLDREGASE